MLPIEYYFNKNAWMTSAVFDDWLHKFDIRLTLQKRNRLVCRQCTIVSKVKFEKHKILLSTKHYFQIAVDGSRYHSDHEIKISKTTTSKHKRV